MDGLSFMALVMACAPLVDPGTARALVEVESAFNPNAIGVVGGALERQPRSKAQALATTRALQEHGWNFSIGLAQCRRRSKSDPPCRSNIDPGMDADSLMVGCGQV